MINNELVLPVLLMVSVVVIGAALYAAHFVFKRKREKRDAEIKAGSQSEVLNNLLLSMELQTKRDHHIASRFNEELLTKFGFTLHVWDDFKDGDTTNISVSSDIPSNIQLRILLHVIDYIDENPFFKFRRIMGFLSYVDPVYKYPSLLLDKEKGIFLTDKHYEITMHGLTESNFDEFIEELGKCPLYRDIPMTISASS